MPLFVSYVCSHSCLALFSVLIILAVSTAQLLWSYFVTLQNCIPVIYLFFAVQLEISVEIINGITK